MKFLIVGAIMVLLLITGSFVYLQMQPIDYYFTNTHNSVGVDVSTLGEYPTTVYFVKIGKIDSDEVVLYLTKKNNLNGEFHTFGFDQGINEILKNDTWEEFSMLVPENKSYINLEWNTNYYLEVNSESGIWKKPFAFKKKTQINADPL
ncbi:MAG: hypothetical protein CSA81_02045 [Acidobacteria bacterium]|nr:MAG: hypothetical protein CSA81_02045 [Acidobacteriota bacterium]